MKLKWVYTLQTFINSVSLGQTVFVYVYKFKILDFSIKDLLTELFLLRKEIQFSIVQVVCIVFCSISNWNVNTTILKDWVFFILSYITMYKVHISVIYYFVYTIYKVWELYKTLLWEKSFQGAFMDSIRSLMSSLINFSVLFTVWTPFPHI